MRIFCSVVQALVPSMLDARHDALLRCLVAAQPVGNHHSRHILAALKQLAEEFLGRGFVPSALHQDIEDVAILINCAQ